MLFRSIVTPTIRDLMLDKDRIGEIRDFIAEGREQNGMQTIDQHLTDLVTRGEEEFEVALAASTRPSDFELNMKTFRRQSTAVRRPAETPEAAPTVTVDPRITGGVTGNFDFLGS